MEGIAGKMGAVGLGKRACWSWDAACTGSPQSRAAPLQAQSPGRGPQPCAILAASQPINPPGTAERDAMEFVYTDELREYMSKKGYDTILLSVFTPHT